MARLCTVLTKRAGKYYEVLGELNSDGKMILKDLAVPRPDTPRPAVSSGRAFGGFSGTGVTNEWEHFVLEKMDVDTDYTQPPRYEFGTINAAPQPETAGTQPHGSNVFALEEGAQQSPPSSESSSGGLD